jgi:glycerol-3-phosphate dehydrogenase
MIAQGEQLMPAVRKVPMRAKMAVARPLIAKSGTDAREVSRTFECFDHARDGMNGFVTIAGGKTTTARAMAEKVADIVCRKLGIAAACRTRDTLLASYRLFFQQPDSRSGPSVGNRSDRSFQGRAANEHA